MQAKYLLFEVLKIKRMKKLLLLSLATAFTLLSFAQNVPPADWSYSVPSKAYKVGDVIEITYKANIPEGMHIYSNDYGDCPPIKAQFIFNKNNTYNLVGGAKPIGSHKYIDEIFECEVADFEEKAEFRQKVKVLSATPQITGILEYQMCTADGMCVQHEYEYDIKGLNIIASADDPVITEVIEEDPPEEEETEEPSTGVQPNDSNLVSAIETLLGQKKPTAITKYGGLIKAEEVDYSSYQRKSEDDTTSCEVKTFEGQTGEEKISYWGFFIIAFLSGLAALLTPCVFPMIPMTVSFFMKEGSKAKAIRSGLIYGLSIIAIYVLIGTLVAATAGEAAANFLSTHWLPNVFFFLIFVIFAASFFGAFEITLPSWLVNKADQQADKGGLTGIFFMAFTIVLVSFSCTGPIVGSILVEAAGGKFLKPLVGMFGFSLAFAIPFALFAIFPNWLNNLPKSGGWLNSVKVVLGFLELAFGLKFLSVADQTYHWGLLDREIYIGLWIVIFTLMGIYLLGKLKFSHDSDIPYLKVPRLMLAIATFSFVVYLLPGLIGAPLKALAGYLPPMSTHDFNIVQKIVNPNNITQGYAGIQPKYNEKLHLPDGLKGYFDYEQGMEVARQIGKPVFLDFTGHGCVNCREVEARVWSDSRVHKYLAEDYVVISLYVDDKELNLPKEEQFYTKEGRLVKTLAKKNSTIQKCYFNANAQPQYALLDNRGELLQPTKAYELNKEKYINFLKAGVKEYKKRMDEERKKG
jgi:thiol:disulfide interchange protein